MSIMGFFHFTNPLRSNRSIWPLESTCFEVKDREKHIVNLKRFTHFESKTRPMITAGKPHVQEVVPIFTVKYYHSHTHFLLAKYPMLIGKNSRSLLSLVIHHILLSFPSLSKDWMKATFMFLFHICMGKYRCFLYSCISFVNPVTCPFFYYYVQTLKAR